MVYKNSIPEASDKLKVSQADLKENFSQLDSLFDVDHVKFSDTSGDAGKHVYTNFVNLTGKGLASPTTSSTELAIYNKDDGAGTPQLFYRDVSSGTEQQITGFLTKGSDGQAPLLGGISIKWGSFSVAVTAAVAKTFVGDFGLNDFGTANYQVFVTSVNTAQDNNVQVTAKSVTGFSVKVTSNNFPTTVSFLAIGL